MELQENGELKQITCLLCSRTFSTNKNLQNHRMTIHEMVFPFKCSVAHCTKSYSIESRLKVHMRTHSGEKPFECLQCGKSFCEKGNLKTHLKFHSSIKPFVCSQCHKSYKTKGHLKDHIEIQHNGYKKYPCSLCQKSFGRSSTLKAHYRTHTGEKNIKCRIDTCNQYFAEKGNMKMHYKRHLIRMRKGKGKHPLEDSDSIRASLKNVNITRPCSNVTLPTEADNSTKRMFIVDKGTNTDEMCKNEPSSKNLINSNEIIQFESDSEELNCDSFIFSFPLC